MSDMILNEQYWMQDFAVTDGDVTRLYASLQQTEQPQKAMSLLAQVVRRKLEKESLELDTQQRHKSVAAAKKLLQDHTVQAYRQTEGYEEGDRLLVAWRGSRRDEWDYGVGEVIKKKVVSEPHYRWGIRLRFADGTERTYIAGTDLNHPQSRKLGLKLFDIRTKEEQPLDKVADQVLHVYGSTLLPHLLGRLDEDNRFVRWAGSCWLAESLPELPEDTLYRAASYLWSREAPSTIESLLQVLGLLVDEPHQWALNLALVADERFKNDGSEAVPQWIAPLPNNLLRLADGTLLDLSMPPDDLWARHHALFRGSVPENWADNPHVLTFGGRWLLDVLLIPLEDDDLKRVRDYLDEQDQAVSDLDILSELFHITPRDDAFDRRRFTLSYRLSQKADELGVEFVGCREVWRWALEGVPIEKPERHRRLPGTDGLPIKYVEVEQVEAELTGDDEPLDEPAEEPPGEWKPTRQTWEYVLTYYDWDNGVLPYHRQTREMIPPLSEGQQRTVLRFMAEQVADEPFEVTLYAHSRAPWLQGMGLRDLFVGYLVPGARIWIDRTEEPDMYKIRYWPTEPRHRRLLFFEEGRVRPVIQEREIICEVDETMLLAEGRYSNIEALDRLDLVDRRTAPKVLARVFELIGLKDESQDVYCACFDDLFPLLCITKPYSRDYVKQILYDRKNYPWFYSDEERGVGWFVYDPKETREVEIVPQPDSTEVISVEVTETTPTRDLWAELESDEQKQALLQAAVQAYMADPAREKVLFLREVAHQRIRELVAEERLDTLTLDEFNRQIWRSGSFKFQGQACRIDSEEADALLGTMSVEELQAAHRTGALDIEGNQTWGSGSHELGPQLSKSDAEKEQLVRVTLRFLLSGEGSIEQRMKQVINEPNGFGMNVVSGILHAVYPEEQILYNSRTVDALEMLGISWPVNWQRNVDTYVTYKDFCKNLQREFGFRSLTDVDWFAYNLAMRRIEGVQTPHRPVQKTRTLRTLGLTYDEFMDRVFNCPRPHFRMTLQELISAAEYLNEIGDSVNASGGLPVVRIFRKLQEVVKNGFEPTYVNPDNTLTGLLQVNYADHGRHFRLYLEVFTMLGYLGVGRQHAHSRRIASFVGDLVELGRQASRTSVMQRLQSRVLSVKFWSPYVSTKSNAGYFQNKSYRPASAIMKYLAECESATTFELAVCFGTAIKGVANENDAVEHALAIREQLPDDEDGQRRHFYELQGWIDNQELSTPPPSSRDPAFRFRNFLEIMKAVGLLESDGVARRWGGRYISETTRSIINARPVTFKNLRQRPESAAMLTVLTQMALSSRAISRDRMQHLLEGQRSALRIERLPFTDVVDEVAKILTSKGVAFHSDSYVPMTPVDFDPELDLFHEEWDPVKSEISRLRRILGY